MLQRWFTRVCEDPILLNDEEVRSFIESDFGVRVLNSTAYPTFSQSIDSTSQCHANPAERVQGSAS